MNSKPQSNQLTTYLPPQIESLSSFQFGKFIIELNISQLQQLNVSRFQFEFLGGKSQFYDCKESNKVYQFPIRSTLWHFYQYLKDMDSIKIKLQSSDFSQLLTCTKRLQLLSPLKVLNKSYIKGNYIANSVELCDIYSKDQQNNGYVMFKVKLEFDEDLHRQILDFVDFQSLLNNPQEIILQNQQFAEALVNNQQKSLPISSKHMSKFSNQQQPTMVNQQNQLNLQNIFPNNSVSAVKNNEEEESRMIEDDIDRMIAEIQNKPYDCSRYLDGNNSSAYQMSNVNQGNNQFMNRNPNQNNLLDTQPVYHSMNFPQQQNVPMSQSMAYDPRINRFQQQSNLRYQNDLNRSQQRSKSPLINNRKYPPMPVLNHQQSLSNTQNIMANTTIYSQGQRRLSPGPGRNRSLNKTHQIAYQRSMKNISMSSMRGSQVNNQSAKGALKIQIHELLGRQLDINDCILRVFVNNDYEDIFNCKGSQQGQVILYNQKVELNECQLYEIEKLRFQMQNWQGKCLYSANFQIQRLLNIPKLQGIFMLNLHPHEQEFYGNQITASQTVLRKIEKPFGQKSLRITISYTEQVDVVQIYFNLSKFSLNFDKCKYKIPYTKETVQFQPTQSHFNIFPHSKTYQKLMIQFWDEKSIIGVSQVNMSNLKNITKSVLECNLEPVYLYDCVFPIKNIMNQNQVGKFKLLICCGNVRQVQHVLNKSMLSRTVSMSEMSNGEVNKTPIEVEYNKKLGVFIKDRKVRQQIQIQVDAQELENNHKQSLQIGNKDDHQVSMLSENQFLQKPIATKQLSKVYSNHLSQQQEIQDLDQSDQQQTQKVTKQKQIKPVFTKKQSIKISQQKTILKKSIVQEKKPVQQKPLKSLQQIICKNIQVSFTPLRQNSFSFYQQLKKSCKPHLLFNFIDIDILIKYMIEFGISKSYITQILQILQPQNGMVNFNLLNDFMMSLQVQGEVKPNLIPGKLFVKMALEQYYHQSCLQIQAQQRELNPDDDENMNEQQWLTKKYLSQISTLDQSIDFNEIRKLFSSLGLKISMNDYTCLKNFLQNEKEIKSFLFQLAESKTLYESMIKSQTNLYQILKMTVIEQILKRKKQQEMNKKYEQNILENLYSSKMYGQSNNQSRIEERSQISNLNESRASNFSQIEEQFKETNMNYNKMSKLSSKQTVINYQKNAKPQYVSHQDNDDDDFIIANLNVKPSDSNKNKYKESVSIKQTKYKNRFQSSDYDQSQKEIINVSKFKQKAPQISLSKTGQTVMKYSSRRKITLDGLQSCKSTYQCQFDMELASPFLKVVIENPFQKKLFFKDSDTTKEQSFQVSNVSSDMEDQIQGQIILCDITEKGEVTIAMARFLVIKGIKSVYALKTLQQQSFSGLATITIQ